MSMSNKILREEIERLKKALGIANRTVFQQMEEIKTLNSICEMNEEYFNRGVEKLNTIIEYLEGRKNV